MKFVDEVPPRKPPGKPARHMEEAEELRANPRQWALFLTAPGGASANAFASGVRSGAYRAFRPSGHFEVSVRGCDIYVRYVGEEKR